MLFRSELRPETLTEMLHNLGAFKPDNQLPAFLLACEADARGRTGFEQADYPQAAFIRAALETALSVDTREALQSNLEGAQIGVAIQRLRSKAVGHFKQHYQESQATHQA